MISSIDFNIFVSIASLSAIMMGWLCFHVYGNKSVLINVLFVTYMLITYSVIKQINFHFLNEYYYVFKVLIELAFIGLGISLRVKPVILIMFLISIVYNIVSFIEFTTYFKVFYDNYEMVMQGLVLSLLLINFKNGVADGTNNDHNNSGSTDDIGYSRFFRWKAS